MAETPYHPFAAKTAKSAVIPAPLEGSKPAMVSNAPFRDGSVAGIGPELSEVGGKKL
jgi:hypothetical protein